MKFFLKFFFIFQNFYWLVCGGYNQDSDPLLPLEWGWPPCSLEFRAT